MSVHVTTKIISACDGGPCPAIRATTDPEMVGIQGLLPSAEELAGIAGEIPGHEGVILFPRALLDRWTREQA